MLETGGPVLRRGGSSQIHRQIKTSQQTIVQQRCSSGKRFCQRSLAILALMHNALAEWQMLLSCSMPMAGSPIRTVVTGKTESLGGSRAVVLEGPGQPRRKHEIHAGRLSLAATQEV